MKPAAIVRFESHGVRLAVTSDDPVMLEAAGPSFPPLRTPLADRRAHRVFHLSSARTSDGKPRFELRTAARTMSSPSLAGVLGALEWELSLCLAERARNRIFVHAGVVEWKDRAILIPGRSFSGKSTLVEQLVRAGFGYLSDEFAVLDPSGACHAFPRTLSLRRDGRIERRTAEELGGHTANGPLPVGCVIATRYEPDGAWKPSRLTPGEGVMALLEHTVAARSRTREVLAVLRASMAHAAAFEGPRGDAAELVHALLAGHLR